MSRRKDRHDRGDRSGKSAENASTLYLTLVVGEEKKRTRENWIQLKKERQSTEKKSSNQQFYGMTYQCNECSGGNAIDREFK